MRPNTRAPNGRTAKPAAKLKSVKMNAAAGLTPENMFFEISAARAPARKKWYHSNMVPSEEANMTRFSTSLGVVSIACALGRSTMVVLIDVSVPDVDFLVRD